jgi:NADPH:quinone reductase-like Zn-dependent oxidoreductase
MKAIIIHEAGGVENLIHTEIPKPVIKENEVLVKVKAISINPVDAKVRGNEGALNWMFENTRPAILGWDISGEIVEKGKAVNDFELNQEVFGMVNFFGHGNAYAEYVAVPADQLALKPKNISHEEAAAATLAPLTAWQVLVERAKIKKGDRVLIHAASGGVGHYAVQIAKNFGAYVIGTSSASNKDFVLSLGADEHIDYKKDSLVNSTSNIDIVLDTVGDETLLNSVDVVKDNGIIITIPSSGFSPEAAEKAKARNIELEFLRVQSNGENMKAIADLLESGKMKSVVSKTFDFSEMDKAHLQIESGRTVGKIVVLL